VTPLFLRRLQSASERPCIMSACVHLYISFSFSLSLSLSLSLSPHTPNTHTHTLRKYASDQLIKIQIKKIYLLGVGLWERTVSELLCVGVRGPDALLL
jgi:hypothetical protein